MSRPWPLAKNRFDLIRHWLQNRDGVVVYENHVLDSSHLGDVAFMPATYLGEDDEFYKAPDRIGDLPSRFQERVDHVHLDEFDGSVDAAIKACFQEVP